MPEVHSYTSHTTPDTQSLPCRRHYQVASTGDDSDLKNVAYTSKHLTVRRNSATQVDHYVACGAAATYPHNCLTTSLTGTGGNDTLQVCACPPRSAQSDGIFDY